MSKKGSVIILAVIALILSGSLALAQENAVGAPGATAEATTGSVVFKVPHFPNEGTVVTYLVKATNLTVSGRDCCVGGDNWLIKATGLLGAGSATTTVESSPPSGDICSAIPTSGYSEMLALPGWRIGIVSVTSGDLPGGFPADMFCSSARQGLS